MPELFDALGSLADRLARRATSHRNNDTSLVAHLDVVASYGVKLVSFEREGRTRVCYDGEAFRRVLALGGSPEMRLRAALALTRPECMARVLVAREALVKGRIKSSFQVLKRDTLLPEKSADSPGALGAFQRWSSADWRAGTVAMRAVRCRRESFDTFWRTPSGGVIRSMRHPFRSSA